MPEHSANDASTMPWTSIQKLVPMSGSISSNGTFPSASFAFDCQVLEHHLVNQVGDTFDIDTCRYILARWRVLRLRSRRIKLTHKCLVLSPCRELAVDLADFFNPLPAFGVLQLEHGAPRPVEVVRDEGYLLAEPVEGVAYDSPVGATPCTSKPRPQSGQTAGTVVVPASLICRYRLCR